MKEALGRPRHRWENKIKMDLQEVDVGAWTGSVWFRIGAGGRWWTLLNDVMYLRVP